MKLLHHEANAIQVKTECDIPLMNSLRRILLSEVRIFAVDVIHIFQNESALDDNQLAHRIGMIPIKNICTGDYVDRQQCTCTLDCDKCCLQFRIELTNTTSENRVVTSSDFTATDHLFPFMEDILICILPPQGSLSLLAKAFLGRGKEHVKWSHVSVPTFYPYPVVQLNVEEDDNRSALKTDLVEFHRNKIKINFGKEMSQLYNFNEKVVNLAMGKSKRIGGRLSVLPHERSFIFSFQTIGTENAKDYWNKGIHTLKSKLHILRNEINAQT